MGLFDPRLLFFLLFIPVIIALYLLKQKAEDKSFSSLMLWREAYENLEASTLWEKLRGNLLMYLQILTAALLALALASPYLKTGGSASGRAILVVDTSASMNSLYDSEQTRLDKALDEARGYVYSMSADARITILTMDQKAVIQAANISDKAEAARVLSSLKAAGLAGNPQVAMNTVSSLLRQDEDCDVVFFTDSAFDTSALPGARTVNVNSMGPNGCIDYVSSGLQNDKLVVLARVSNPSPYELSTDVNLYLDGELADIQEVYLAPDESKIVFFEGINPSGTVVMAELNQKDLLPDDNRAYALLNEQTQSRALLISPGNVFLEKSISLTPGLELYKSAELVDFSTAPDFDLYIFDSVTPDFLPPSGNVILINPDREIDGVFPSGEIIGQVSVTAAASPVTTYLEDYSFGVAKVNAVTPPPWAKSFFTAGSLSAGYYGGYDGRTVGVVCFDLHDSDFALQVEFPIFVHNLLTQCSGWGILYGSRYSTGDTLALRPGMITPGTVIVNPLGEVDALPYSESSVTYNRLSYAGIYRVTDYQDVDAPFIVSFPVASESRVETLDFGDAAGASARTSASGIHEMRRYIIIFALVLLLTEWTIYLRSAARGRRGEGNA